MIKRLLLLVTVSLPSWAFAQFGANFHQSDLPFVGINYELKDRIRPEIRVGLDTYIRDIPFEFDVMYDVLNKEEYEVYGGLGFASNVLRGLVIPVGVNIYPFTAKNFGFQIELAPILGEGNVFRGSWGIRYRFRKKVQE